MLAKAFRILAALLVAVPLGIGGLCCCLIGASPAGLELAAIAPPSSCCDAARAPAPPADCPEDDEDCSCPSREAGLLAKSAPTETVNQEAPASALPQPLVSVAEFQARTPLPARVTPYPPPKVPLHRTLCVTLC
jgi:hypothetical protein